MRTIEGVAEEYLCTVRRELDRDGYLIEPNGRITGGPAGRLRDSAIAAATDASAIREHLDRISRAVENEDPAQVIGSAKELIESTAKVVLVQRGMTVNDKDDLPSWSLSQSRLYSFIRRTMQAGPIRGKLCARSWAAQPQSRQESPNCGTEAMALATGKSANE
jgi:hypothetical protein